MAGCLHILSLLGLVYFVYSQETSVATGVQGDDEEEIILLQTRIVQQSTRRTPEEGAAEGKGGGHADEPPVDQTPLVVDALIQEAEWEVGLVAYESKVEEKMAVDSAEAAHYLVVTDHHGLSNNFNAADLCSILETDPAINTCAECIQFYDHEEASQAGYMSEAYLKVGDGDCPQKFIDWAITFSTVGCDECLNQVTTGNADDDVAEPMDNDYSKCPSMGKCADNVPDLSIGAGSWGKDRIDQALGLDEVFNSAVMMPVGDKFRVPAGKGTHYYLCDSGIYFEHDEFEGRADGFAEMISLGGEATMCTDWAPPADIESTATYNPEHPPKCADDLCGHGSLVGGVVISRTFGVAPRMKLHSTRIWDHNCLTSKFNVASSFHLVAAAETFPNFASTQCMLDGYDVGCEDAVTVLVESGAVLLTAAGQSEKNACHLTPMYIPNGITIGSTALTVEGTDTATWHSNHGHCVDIYGPGYQIWSTLPHNHMASVTGTSFATPHAVGISAMIAELEITNADDEEAPYPDWLQSDNINKMYAWTEIKARLLNRARVNVIYNLGPLWITDGEGNPVLDEKGEKMKQPLCPPSGWYDDIGESCNRNGPNKLLNLCPATGGQPKCEGGIEHLSPFVMKINELGLPDTGVQPPPTKAPKKGRR